MKLTKKLGQRVEDVLETAGYAVRYEKGNFRGGYCVVEQQRLIMVNKFFPLEGRVSTLIDVLLKMQVDDEALTKEQRRLIGALREYKSADA